MMNYKNDDIEREFMDMIKLNERIIYKIASFYANKDHSVNDLYQEVILNLWKSYPSFKGDSKVSTWLYRVALNTCITFFRRSKIDLYYTDSIADTPEMEGGNDNLKELYAMIDRLGQLEKALVLLYLEEKSYKEIAEIMGLTVTNVATKIGRIKDKLKKMSNR